MTTSSDSKEINLHLDDPNISRAAFELLLARLYSTGPRLALDPATHPTPLHPLTPSFPPPTTGSAAPPPPTTSAKSNLEDSNPQSPSEQSQPGTPRFLLSILATSIYLDLPGITASVLSLIVGSTSPFSICHFLNFAVGKGIGGYGGEEWEDGFEGRDGKGAVGLEHLGGSIEKEASEEDIEDDQIWLRGRKVGKERLNGSSETGLEKQVEAIKLDNPTADDTTPMPTGLPSRSNSQLSRHPSTATSTSSPPISRSSSRRGPVRDTRHPLDRSPAPSRRRRRRTSSTSTTSIQSHLIGAIRDTARSSPASSSISSDDESDQDKGALRTVDSVARMKADDADDYDSDDGEEDEELEYFYGATSDRIGEACTCWLARWGVDVLAVEEGIVRAAKGRFRQASRGQESESASSPASGKGKGREALSTNPSSAITQNRQTPATSRGGRYRPIRRVSSPHHKATSRLRPISPPPPIKPSSSSTTIHRSIPLSQSSAIYPISSPPPVWAPGGLTASWIRAIISSDAFFLSGRSLDNSSSSQDDRNRGEMERYRVARRVWELRLGDRAREKAAQKERNRVALGSDGGSSDEDLDESDWEWEEEEEEFEGMLR